VTALGRYVRREDMHLNPSALDERTGLVGGVVVAGLERNTFGDVFFEPGRGLELVVLGEL